MLSALVTFIILFIILYQRRYYRHIKEKQLLETHYTQQLLQSQLEMQEQTFNSISQEIHDNVGQVLSLAKVQLNIMAQQKAYNENMVADVKESVGKAMTDLRDIAKSLNSDRIRDASLPEITALELQRISRAGIMIATLQTEGEEHHLRSQNKLIVFRIIQEALHNSIKHSAATTIEVRFLYSLTDLTIHIADNGIGFDMELLSKKDGLGLKNMINRAALIGGNAKIESSINKGTFITLSCPYD